MGTRRTREKPGSVFAMRLLSISTAIYPFFLDAHEGDPCPAAKKAVDAAQALIYEVESVLDPTPQREP